MGTPRRLTSNGLPVYYLYLAAELFRQLSPDLDGDRLRLKVLRSRPVTDGIHSPPPLIACPTWVCVHVHGSGGAPWWTILLHGGAAPPSRLAGTRTALQTGIVSDRA